MLEFEEFPKIPRAENTNISVTEKIDGTNAQIIVPEDPSDPLIVGSRNRFITPGKTTDNFGFAAWVQDHSEQLRLLGPGKHYGEWFGQGIGRGYEMLGRRFCLFNTTLPLDPGLPFEVGQVPVLASRQLVFDTDNVAFVNQSIANLRMGGSLAVPGFMKPEGVVVKIGQSLYKVIFDKQGPSPEEVAA